MQNGGWDKFRIAVEANLRRVFLWGPPGLGKSHMSNEICLTSNTETKPFQITLNEDLTVQEILGHFIPEGDKFVWHDGPVSAAMRHGIPLIINEAGRASGAVQDMLLGVLDDPSIAAVTLPNGDRLVPKDGFRVFATSNSGPGELDEALRDRFDAKINVTQPHPNLVAALNKRKKDLGNYILDSYKDPDRALSPRRALTFLALLDKNVKVEEAAQIAFDERHIDVLMSMRARSIAI